MIPRSEELGRGCGLAGILPCDLGSSARRDNALPCDPPRANYTEKRGIIDIDRVIRDCANYVKFLLIYPQRRLSEWSLAVAYEGSSVTKPVGISGCSAQPRLARKASLKARETGAMTPQEVAALLQEYGGGDKQSRLEGSSDPSDIRLKRAGLLSHVLAACRDAWSTKSEQLDLIAEKLGDGSRDGELQNDRSSLVDRIGKRGSFCSMNTSLPTYSGMASPIRRFRNPGLLSRLVR